MSWKRNCRFETAERVVGECGSRPRKCKVMSCGTGPDNAVDGLQLNTYSCK